jgi:MFS family permease
MAQLPERARAAAHSGHHAVVAAFTLANLAGSSNISSRDVEYGFPLTYRKHFHRPVGVDKFHPGALGFDIAIAALAIASTFVATGRWSGQIGRYRRFTIRGLMATVALFAVLFALPILALAVIYGALLFGLVCIVHVIVLITFHRRPRAQADRRLPAVLPDDGAGVSRDVLTRGPPSREAVAL